MHPLSMVAALRGRVRALFRRDAVERQFDDEIRFHLDMQTQRNVAAGLRPAEARRAALIAFGGVERVREDHRDARGERLVEDAVADVRYAVRWLARSRGFAFSAVMTLALGIGGTTAAFCVVDGVLLKPLPYPDADRLVAIWSVTRGNTEPWSTTPPGLPRVSLTRVSLRGSGSVLRHGGEHLRGRRAGAPAGGARDGRAASGVRRRPNAGPDVS